MRATKDSSVRLIHNQGNTKRHVNEVTDRGEGVRVPALFTKATKDPWLFIDTESRTAKITDPDGNITFEQPVEDVPSFWSQMAVNVVANKYFRGTMGTPERERSIRKLIARVVSTIKEWGVDGGYFKSEQDADNFYNELTHLIAHQMFSFNSPVWFNVGAEGEEYPQCSACFINEVQDDMESIMALASTEARLFKGGSGAGCNLSTLRSSKEGLSGGGIASGPVSFMKGYDAFAGVIKSGGKTRRAAKMVVLDCDHPDILDFVTCKAREEKKAWALIDAGYDADFRGEAYSSVFFQNANHSIRVSDAFMTAAISDDDWDLLSVRDKEPIDSIKAKDLLMEVARAAHLCGDPGIQYDTTINDWHTCKSTDRIYASNPCSEFMFLNNTACNLGSLNLLKFLDDYSGGFNTVEFMHAVNICILAQEILVDYSSYPTEDIAVNSHLYRPLGLGFANLGALLMTMGHPYDSEEGRHIAGAITSTMTGQAYGMSAEIAQDRGPFAGYSENREPMDDVMSMHRAKAFDTFGHNKDELSRAACSVWDHALAVGSKHGYRNAQVTVLAPTGTIAFMMDCDTTGIEPDISLIKYKKLVGGGTLKIVNHAVPVALKKLGYQNSDIEKIMSNLEETGETEGSGITDRHLPVFDCALGRRAISPKGHMLMMAACQPFLSGAISKTVNIPREYSPEDIYNMYVEGWSMGLKALAVYRDGSKMSQPLDTKKEKQEAEPVLVRRKLPNDREARTHKFSIGGHEGYLTYGMYPDGSLGEIFITMSKEGSTVSGLMDTIAIQTSMLLQYGVPLDKLVKRFGHVRFEPSGFTGNKDVPIAKSIVDYIFRFLGSKFLTSTPIARSDTPVTKTEYAETSRDQHQDAPACINCGSITRRSGTCYVCESCGETTGCG